MFCSMTLVLRIIALIAGRYALTFIPGKIMNSRCLSGKHSVSCTPKGVAA